MLNSVAYTYLFIIIYLAQPRVRPCTSQHAVNGLLDEAWESEIHLNYSEFNLRMRASGF